jgi:hypothetical protein
MSMSRYVLAAALLALGLGAVTDGAGAPPAKRAKGTGKKAKLKQDNVLVGELRHAHKVLKAADPIYHGHRAQALHEINHAIGALEKEMKKRGLKAHDRHGANVPKNVSDALVAETIADLGTILGQLNSLPATPHRTKAAGHLDTAVKQLGEALESARNKTVKK